MTLGVKDKVLEMLSDLGVFAEPEVIDYLAGRDDPVDYCARLLKVEDEVPLFLNMEIIVQMEGSLQKKEALARKGTQVDLGTFRKGADTTPEEVGAIPKVGPDPAVTIEQAGPDEKGSEDPGPSVLEGGSMAPDFDPMAARVEGRFRLIRDITDRSTCEGELKDFGLYFRNRYLKLKKMIRNRIEMGSSTSIEYAKEKNLPGDVKIIGMVSDVRSAPWGGLIVRIEDDTAEITATLAKDENVVKDEVVGLIGRIDARNLRFGKQLRCKSVVRPGLTITRTPNRSTEPAQVMFISDIHLGSNTFLHRQWRSLIRWLNGHIDSQRRLAGQIKYLVINGDIVDGIGVFPRQEEELDIKDIFAQYEELGRQLRDIPGHIEIIILPGNHDAVRPAEPQPTFPKEIRDLFPKNCTFLGNPSTFSLDGVEVLAYHGRSMDDLIPALKLSYERPTEVMKMMLQMRHLAPIYGDRTPIAPEREDILVIDRVPDIFVTGHLHKTEVKSYCGVLLIQSSAWQAQTSYQKMMNIQPDPAKAVVVDLQTLVVKKLNFMGEPDQ